MELEQQDRLRNAFAQLLAQGNNQAAPVEALWARQGLDQLAPSPPVPGKIMDRTQSPVDPSIVLPQRQFDLADPNAHFPTAEQGPGDTRYRPAEREKPFKGKGEIVGPYELPKSKKKGKR